MVWIIVLFLGSSPNLVGAKHCLPYPPEAGRLGITCRQVRGEESPFRRWNLLSRTNACFFVALKKIDEPTVLSSRKFRKLRLLQEHLLTRNVTLSKLAPEDYIFVLTFDLKSGKLDLREISGIVESPSTRREKRVYKKSP